MNYEDFYDPASGERLQLEIAKGNGDQIVEGTYRNASGDQIGRIVNGIPRFVEDEGYTGGFGMQWNRHRVVQLDSQTGSTYSMDRIVRNSGWERDLSGQRVLEAGSGAGRFTEVLAETGADLRTFDFSSAVEANYRSNGARENVTVFQGDIYNIPYPDAYFDKVLCYGVLQHTPDVERTFKSLAAKVRPGGSLTVDVYPKTIWQMAHWKYLMRPVTTRMDEEKLYRFVEWYAPKLMPLAKIARRFGGKAGARLVPILDQSDKHVSPEFQREWTILDTFDALSPAYDQPQTAKTIRRWYAECGFENVHFPGNGVGGRGTKKMSEA